MSDNLKNKAYFRFYEELNDFLSSDKVKKKFPYLFTGKVSVKDAIESLGIPHTEIDLILVNGESVGFEHILQNGEHISVYPVFESLDIASLVRLRPESLRNPTFIVDVNLGKLARLLRMLGFDANWRNDLNDPEIIEISISEKRIILTRDIGILKNRKVTRGYFVRSDDPDIQIVEVLKRFELIRLIKPFTRCMECNEFLKEIRKEEISELLPSQASSSYVKFMQCAGCHKIYWGGSHYDKMLEYIKGLEGKCEISRN